tara:strand:- start:1870 stop:3732 length:1863 start_codon:yes stop_codon:yes gene_type:complete
MANVRTELSSSKMFEKGSEDLGNGVISDSTYNWMSASFKTNEYLEDSGILGSAGPIIYQMHLIQEDMADVYAQISKSQHTNEEMTYKNVTADNLKVNALFTAVSSASLAYVNNDVEIEDDVTLGGSLLPKNAKGQNLGSAKNRWSRLYVASTIDTSGSLQVDFSSGSTSDGMIVTGSLTVTGSNTLNVKGPTIITGSLEITTGSAVGVNDGDFLVEHGTTKLKELTTTSTFNLGGNIIPTTKGLTIGGAGKTERFSRVYLASTIDVSGSQLHIQPSQSMTPDDFSVVVSGSMIPGDLNTGSIGTLAEPFKDLYVQSGSIHFADITKKTGGRSWGAQSDDERKVHTTRFGKEEIDKLYNGEPLQPQGNQVISGSSTIIGDTMISGSLMSHGRVHMYGITHLSGSTTAVGDFNIHGPFKVNGNLISADEMTQLAGLTATTTELNLTDGASRGVVRNEKCVVYGTDGEVNTYELQLSGSAVTTTAAEINVLDGVKISTAELNYSKGVTSDIQTQLNDKLSTELYTPTIIGSQPSNGDLGNLKTLTYEVAVKGAVCTITKAAPLFKGQRLLIYANTAASITHTKAGKASANTFSMASGKNLSMSAGTTHEFYHSIGTNQWHLIT